MRIWCKKTREEYYSTVPYNQNIYTPIQPKFTPYEVWIDDTTGWGLDYTYKKSQLVAKSKICASNKIYAVYPAYKQTNLQIDIYEQAIIVSIGLKKSIELVNAMLYPMVLPLNTTALIALRTNINTVDLSAYVASAPVESRSALTLAIKKMLLSMIANRLKNIVQDWCNAKETEILNCDNSKLDEISFDDCPNLA